MSLPKSLRITVPIIIIFLFLQCSKEDIHTGTNFTTDLDSLNFNLEIKDPDWVFISPQTTEFIITFTNSSPDKAKIANMVIEISTDDNQPVNSVTYPMKIEKNDKSTLTVKPEINKPGFYQCSISLKNDEVSKLVHQFTFGYDPEKIQSPADAKADFLSFWNETKKELEKIKPDFKTNLLKDKSSQSKNMYHVEMISWGNEKIEGYYTVPVKSGKYPAMIRFNGYGAGPIVPNLENAPGFCEFMFFIRGQGIQKPENKYGDWVVYGLQSKETYYYRQAFMDIIRSIDFIASRPEVDPTKIVVEGASQGGASALVASALDERVAAAAIALPFLSDYKDYFQIAPWPKLAFQTYLDKNKGQSWEKTYELLTYFDIKNMAPQVVCPVIMRVGLQDKVCPPHINFAAYNLISSKDKRYEICPTCEHNTDEAWRKNYTSFFKEILKIE